MGVQSDGGSPNGDGGVIGRACATGGGRTSRGECTGSVASGKCASSQALALRLKPRPLKMRCMRERFVMLPLLLQLLLGLPGRAAGLPASDAFCGCTRRALNAAVILCHTVGLPEVFACKFCISHHQGNMPLWTCSWQPRRKKDFTGIAPMLLHFAFMKYGP